MKTIVDIEAIATMLMTVLVCVLFSLVIIAIIVIELQGVGTSMSNFMGDVGIVLLSAIAGSLLVAGIILFMVLAMIIRKKTKNL